MNPHSSLRLLAATLAGFTAASLSALATAPPHPPINLAVTVTGLSTVNLTWQDASANETGFHVWSRSGASGNFSYLGALPANTTSVPLSGLAVGTAYQFAVASYNAAGYLEPPIVAVTMPGVTSRGFHPAVVGQSFAYTLTASSDGGAPASYGLTGILPAGLAFNAGTHQITGTPAEAGVFTLTNSVHYPAWGTLSKPFTLRVIHPAGPPIAPAAIPTQTLSAGGPAVSLPLRHYFVDRDTEQAVRFVTTLGNFDLALYATATPQTVSNFLNYVDRGDYSESIVHRAAPNFVVQGGGFKPAPPNFTRIPTDPSPTNEPGIQHVRGTVAMAKVGGNPNSATCQWFVNLKDNSAELDDQNGGFASFGRVCGSGLDVIDAMAALPRGAYAVNVDGQTNTFTDWPLNTAPPAPATMDQSKLVLVTSVRRIEPLSFSVPGSTVPGVATAAVVGTNLMLSPSGIYGGTTVVSVVATDLDGHSLTQAVTVEVASAYSSWLARYSLQGPDALPGADYDGDTRPNAVEFALGGSPVLSDADTIRPVPLVVNLGGSVYGALAFRLRKDLSGLMVWLKSAPAVAGASWNNVWSSADLTGSQVWQRTNQGEFWWLTVRDATPLATGTSQRFLRLVVSVSP